MKGVVAIDGNALRRSHDRAAGKNALHLVSAWAVEHRVVLAHLATDETSTEITAIPLLFRQFVHTGCMVTSDAMGTHWTIVEQTIEHEGDDALALTDTRGNLPEDVKATYAMAENEGGVPVHAESHRQVENGQG